MKKITCFFISCVMMVALICSCSSAPDYRKLIPADAYFVGTLNVEEAVKSSDIGKAEALVRYVSQSLAHAQLPPSTREHLQNILDDPQKCGVDFQQPLMLFASSKWSNKMGILGAVSDAGDMENFLDILSHEGFCTFVMELDGLKYTAIDNVVMAFNDEWFFLTKMSAGQKTPGEVLAAIQGLASQPEEASLQGNKAFASLFEREGFLHLLYLGSGVEDQLAESDLSIDQLRDVLPEGVDISDFSLLFDARLTEGEAALVGEVLPLSDGAEDWLESFDAFGNIKGSLADYVPENALFYCLTNMNGKSLYQYLRNDGNLQRAAKKLGLDEAKMESIFADIQGDAAFVVGSELSAMNLPSVAYYAETGRGDWLGVVSADTTLNLQKIDDRTYSYGIPDPRYTSFADASQNPPMLASVVLGVKKGISYLLFDKENRTLDKVDFPIAPVTDCNFYARLSAGELLHQDFIKDQIGLMGYLSFKKMSRLFDCLEFTVENHRKATFRIVMTDKEQSPVKSIYQEFEKLLDAFS